MIRKTDIIMQTVVFSSIALGLMFPAWFEFLSVYTAPALMALLFFSFIKIFPEAVWAALKKYPGRLTLLVAVKLVVLPALVYPVALYFAPDFALGLLFLAGVSTGVIAPFMTGLIGGSMPLSLIMAVSTTLLLPLSLPLMVRLLAGSEIAFNVTDLALMLAVFIFVPMALAGLGRRFLPKALDYLEARTFPVSMLLFAIINLGSFSKYAAFLTTDLNRIFWAGMWAVGLCLVMFAAGALLIRRPMADRLAASGSIGWINNILIIVVGSQIGDPMTSVMGALYLAPYYLMTIPLNRLSGRAGKGANIDK